MAGRGKPPAGELVALLNRIARDEGSLNKAADGAGINRSSYQRAANGQGGFSGPSAERLAQTYGDRYGFTARQIREWGLGFEVGDLVGATRLPGHISRADIEGLKRELQQTRREIEAIERKLGNLPDSGYGEDCPGEGGAGR